MSGCRSRRRMSECTQREDRVVQVTNNRGSGRLIIELKNLSRVELDPHQVDVVDPSRLSLTPSSWEVFDWLSQ